MLVIKNLKNDRVVIASSEMQVIKDWINNKVMKCMRDLAHVADKIKELPSYDTRALRDWIDRQQTNADRLEKYNELMNIITSKEVFNITWQKNVYIEFEGFRISTIDQENLEII